MAWPLRLTVRTSDSHSENRSSILLEATGKGGQNGCNVLSAFFCGGGRPSASKWEAGFSDGECAWRAFAGKWWVWVLFTFGVGGAAFVLSWILPLLPL